MPKFNMSKEEAKALADYFAGVSRQTNTGVGLSFPFESIAAPRKTWTARTGAKKQRRITWRISRVPAGAFDMDGKPIKGKTAFEQRVEDYTPVWEKLSKAQEASLKAELQKLKDAGKVREGKSAIDAKAEGAQEATRAKKRLDLQKGNRCCSRRPTRTPCKRKRPPSLRPPSRSSMFRPH